MRLISVAVVTVALILGSSVHSFSIGSHLTFSHSPGNPQSSASYLGHRAKTSVGRLAPGTAFNPSIPPGRAVENGSQSPALPRYFKWLSSAGQGVFLRRAKQPDALATSPKSAQRRGSGAHASPSFESPQFAPPTTITSLDQFVNDPELDSVDFHTQSETSICANGNNLVESFNDTSGFNGPVASIDGYAVSSDGGNTWTHARIPQTDKQQTNGDGVVTFGAHGEVYYASLLATGPSVSTSAIGVAKSTDGGQTFTTMVDASTKDDSDAFFNDKEWIRADRGSSQFSGNVYVSWTHFGAMTTIDFSRSTDGGQTFSFPISVSNGMDLDVPQGSNIAVSADGTINLVYFDLNEGTGAASILYAKSTDGGQSFSPPATIANFLSNTVIGDMTGIGNVRSNNFPMVAVGPDGSIHVVYAAQPALLGPDRSDVFYVRSTDGGNTFSTPRRLNDDSTTTTQMFPSIGVTSSGAVGVRWWDRRNDPVSDGLTDVYMVISQDLGNTFGPNFRVTKQSSIYTPIEFILAAGYHGDYDSMTADGDNFYVPWSGEWRGNPDAYFAKVPSNFSPGPDFVIESQRLYNTVAAGSATDVSIELTTINGFSNNLTFASLTQVSGVTLTFSAVVEVPTTKFDLSIQTDPSVVPGAYLFGITATGGGITHGSAFWLNVLPPNSSPPADLSSTPGFSQISSGQEVDSNGVIHLAFYDDSDAPNFGEKVYYSRSSDGGRTFSPKLQISTTGESATAPILRVDPGGNVYVAWMAATFQDAGGSASEGSPSIEIVKSGDGGLTFSQPTALTLPEALFQFISFDVANDGSLTLTYIDDIGDFSAVESSNGGQTFSSPVQINEPTDLVLAASTFSDRKGSIAASYFAITLTRNVVSAAISHDNGQTFSAPARLTSSAAGDVPVVTIGPDGSAYVLYATSKALLLSAAPPGRQFGPGARVTKQFVPPFTMSVDSTGTVFVGYVGLLFDQATSTLSIPVSITRTVDKGKSFSIPVLLTSSQNVGADLNIMPDGAGNIRFAWSEVDTGLNTVILLSQSSDGGATFSPSADISNSPGNSHLPVMGVLPDGRLSLIWMDDSYENDEVVSTVLPAIVASAPGFALVSQTDTAVTTGTGTNLVVSVSRPGQFSGAVTVAAPKHPPAGVTISPSKVTTTTTNARFLVTLTRAGTFSLNFTGSDAAGAKSTATITLMAQ